MGRTKHISVAFVIAALAILPIPSGYVSAATPKCNGKTATIVGTGISPLNGTAGDDVIVGTDAAETINGGAGNDTICGRGGNDAINGEGDNDTIFGENGDDAILNGGLGNDTVYGGDGNDSLAELAPDGGDDIYFGGNGNDLILDGKGFNVAHGDSGNDEVGVFGQAYGDAGDDPLVQATEYPDGAGNGYADGGSGSDGYAPALTGAPGVSVNGGRADGGSGNDIVYGIKVGDEILGGSGSDFVDGSLAGAQLLDCGAAYDGYATDGTDTIRRCEELGINPNTPN